MRGAIRDGALFLGCVVFPCYVGWTLEDPSQWQWTHGVGAGLFVISTLLVFAGLRLLIPVQPSASVFSFADFGTIEPFDLNPELRRPHPLDELDTHREERRVLTSSEIIHVEHGPGSARVVALLHMGDGPLDLHLLELDVTGDDLRPEVIAEAVAGVASGEPTEDLAPVDRVGYASGWGLTLPCPPFRH